MNGADEMLKVKEETDRSICIEGLVTICPRNCEKDLSRVQIEFIPNNFASSSFVKNEIKKCVESIEGEIEWMEIIPLRILDCIIKRCVKNFATLMATPEKISIRTFSKSESGKRKSMSIKIFFQRQINRE